MNEIPRNTERSIVGECRLSYVVDVKSCLHEDLAHKDYDPKPYPQVPKDANYILHHVLLDLACAYPT